MLFLLVLALATAATVIVDRQGSWRDHARHGLSAAMIIAGIAHLVTPTPFIQHLPDWAPLREEAIAMSGIVEIGLGAGLWLTPAWRAPLGLLLAAYLVAVFPANVYVAVEGVDVDGQPGGLYPWLRLPLQAVFIALALWSSRAGETLASLRQRAVPAPPRGRRPSMAPSQAETGGHSRA